MKFKDLEIGAEFDFDHSHLSSWSGALGPWIKTGKRTYDHKSLSLINVKVGTINVSVIQGEDK